MLLGAVAVKEERRRIAKMFQGIGGGGGIIRAPKTYSSNSYVDFTRTYISPSFCKVPPPTMVSAARPSPNGTLRVRTMP